MMRLKVSKRGVFLEGLLDGSALGMATLESVSAARLLSTIPLRRGPRLRYAPVHELNSPGATPIMPCGNVKYPCNAWGCVNPQD